MDIESLYHIPNGTKNLAVLFPSVPWKDVEEYYVEVTNLEDEIQATTCNNVIRKSFQGTEGVRVYFLNGLGGIDAINFCQVEEEYETKSDSRESPLSVPLIKSQGGTTRFNVKTNETYRVTTPYATEGDMQWLKELLRSPAVWMEYKGTQGQPDDYLPIVLSDGKFITRKIGERHTYQFTVEYRLSNTNITIRT